MAAVSNKSDHAVCFEDFYTEKIKFLVEVFALNKGHMSYLKINTGKGPKRTIYASGIVTSNTSLAWLKRGCAS